MLPIHGKHVRERGVLELARIEHRVIVLVSALHDRARAHAGANVLLANILKELGVDAQEPKRESKPT